MTTCASTHRLRERALRDWPLWSAATTRHPFVRGTHLYEAPICRGEHRSSAAGGTEKKPPVQIRTGCGIRICIGGIMNWYFRRRAGIGCDIRALCDGPLFDAKPVHWESYFVTLRVQPLRGWCGVFCTFSLLYRMGILIVRSVTGQAEQAWNQPSSLSIMRRPSP